MVQSKGFQGASGPEEPFDSSIEDGSCGKSRPKSGSAFKLPPYVTSHRFELNEKVIGDEGGKVTPCDYVVDGNSCRAYGQHPWCRQPAEFSNRTGAYELGCCAQFSSWLGYAINSWDSHGNLASILYADGGGVTMAYDVLNRMVAQTDQLGRITSFQYDPADHIIARTNPLNETTTYIYETCLLQATVTPLNLRTTNAYDRYNNLTSKQNPLGYVWTYLFDNVGSPIGTIDPVGNQTTTTWNSASQKVADFDQLGYGTTYGYDNANRQLTVQNARNYVTTTIWNARDAIARQDALGTRWTAVFDPQDRQISSISPLGIVSTTVYDAAGQTVQIINGLSYVMSMNYDAAGNQISTEDANGIFTTSIYSPTSNRRGKR